MSKKTKATLRVTTLEMRRSARTVAIVGLIALALSLVTASSFGAYAKVRPALYESQSLCVVVPKHATEVGNPGVDHEIWRSALGITEIYDQLDAPPDASSEVRGMGRIARLGVILAFGRWMFEQFDQDQQKIILGIAGQVYDSVKNSSASHDKKKTGL